MVLLLQAHQDFPLRFVSPPGSFRHIMRNATQQASRFGRLCQVVQLQKGPLNGASVCQPETLALYELKPALRSKMTLVVVSTWGKRIHGSTMPANRHCLTGSQEGSLQQLREAMNGVLSFRVLLYAYAPRNTFYKEKGYSQFVAYLVPRLTATTRP